MIINERRNLTRAQVEALMECFDFLQNGYVEYQFLQLFKVWVVSLKHQRTKKDIHVFIYPNRYRIRVDRKTRKIVEFRPSGERYRIMVNSDASIGVVRQTPSGGVPVVSG